MFKVMLQKLWHKKWMSVSLLVGIMLLTATAVSFPMYRSAAYNRMIQDLFDQYLSSTGEWPAINVLTMSYQKGIRTFQDLEQLMAGFYGELGVTEKETIVYHHMSPRAVRSLMKRDDLFAAQLRISSLSRVEDHIRFLAGECYSETGITEDGSLEAIVSQTCLTASHLLVGETVEFESVMDYAGNPLRIKIVGVFEAEDLQDTYWQTTPDAMNNICLIKESVFRDYFIDRQPGAYFFTSACYAIWDYKTLRADEIGLLAEKTRYFMEESPYAINFTAAPYLNLLDQYQTQKIRIDVTLLLLQIPIWILLGAFLFMISTQMYEVERNEISVLKSRGGSGMQIFRIYLYQCIFLTILGTLAGLPLGRLFALALGSTGSFLEFEMHRTLYVEYTNEVLYFSLAAMLGCILMITLPAIKHSRVTIVHLKQQKAEQKWSWWEKCFLDVILLAISLYGYYTSTHAQDIIEQNVMQGATMEPLLYISSSLFILGMGLLMLRLQPLLIRFLYLAGKRFWRPAAYISFMENRKNGRKQQFIMLFMILSIALGMFYSVVARTILQNARENVSYLDGADLIVSEVWRDNSSMLIDGEATTLIYYEPDYGKYDSLQGANLHTRVILDNRATAATIGGNGQERRILLMGIHTKEFGEITDMPSMLLEKHYYEYLNELAVNPEGILVSAAFRDNLGYQTGDYISYYSKDRKYMRGQIIDFVEYWPGFTPSEKRMNPDGSVYTASNYLIIANIGTLLSAWGTVPYQVWIDLEDGADNNAFYQWLEEKDVSLSAYKDRQKDLDAVTEDPLLQGTNGILTMGFLVTILLCTAGYLIYWILSIRSREMVFGTLRANGMHRTEIFHLLINEQLFCGGYAILVGAFVGSLVSKMFVPVLQTAYAAANQVLPMRLITQSSDMLRLYGVIGGMVLVCLLVLVVLVRKLNVAKALKLGEE